MSILIPGMEMPTSCVLCRMSEYHVTNPYCKITEAKILRNRERNNDCPLVLVPEYDGPLVDALDIINAFPDGFIFTNEQARALTNYIIPADKEGEG